MITISHRVVDVLITSVNLSTITQQAVMMTSPKKTLPVVTFLKFLFAESVMPNQILFS